MTLTIEFMDSIKGMTKKLNLDVEEQCPDCLGSGALSREDIKTCNNCHGSGRVIRQQRTMFGMMQTEGVCPECQGSGKKIEHVCSRCRGRGFIKKKIEVEVNIPAGIADGQQLRIPGKGDVGLDGGPNGDLYIEIRVKEDKNFIREGNDILVELPLTPADAALGCKIDIPTVYGDVELTVPAGTQPNQRFRMKGKGVKDPRGGMQGDQYVQVSIEIPKNLSIQERELYEKLKNLEGKKKDSVFKKFKKSFK